MKGILLILSLTALVLAQTSCNESGRKTRDKSTPVGDTSRNALDWQGTYYGLLPCADCEGIETVIRLYYDDTFVLQTKYLGKDEQVFEHKGRFSWDEAGLKIALELPEGSGASGRYQVGENQLFHLDMDGNRITGDLASHYILAKVPESLSGRTWRLIEAEEKPFVMKEAYFRFPSLIFHEEEGRFSGNAGCNNIMRRFKLEGSDSIRFSQVVSTLMACPDMELERKFLEEVETIATYELGWDTLSLYGKGEQPIFRFAADYFLKIL